MEDYFKTLKNPFEINIDLKHEYTNEDLVVIQNKLREKNLDEFIEKIKLSII